MAFEKYSFIGKIDKIDNDFNGYLDQISAMKNIIIDPNQIHAPEFYLQTIINRKRPETAVPCNTRTNRKSSFEENDAKMKSNRIKTSIHKRESLRDNSINNLNSHSHKTNSGNNNLNKNYYPNYEDLNNSDFFPEHEMENENGNDINHNNNNEFNNFPSRIQAKMTQTMSHLNNPKTREVLNEIRRLDNDNKSSNMINTTGMYRFKNLGKASIL